MPKRPLEDADIIALYEQRDERAISETEQKYGGYCYCIANNILENTQDAEECMNDLYLKVWNCIPPQRPNCLKFFLGKIVRNLSLDRYRKNHREKRGNGEVAEVLDELDSILVSSSDVVRETEQRELLGRINHFLYALPERERNIFIRRYFYLESTGAIARRYAINEGHILVILSRVRKKLRYILESEGFIL